MFISPSELAGDQGGRRLDDVAAALRAAGDPSRLRALALLTRGELAVGELATALAQSQPRVSRHMKVLTEFGLAERAPEGAWVFYRLPPPGAPARALVEGVLAAIAQGDPQMRADLARLEAVRAARAAAAERYFESAADDWAHTRTRHIPDADIETALLDMAGPGPFEVLVDVGAGAGRMLALFAPFARRLEGFDLNRRMLAAARAALADQPDGKITLRLGDVYDPPLPPAKADLVVIHHVLHYLPDPGRAVARAVGLARPGGRVLIADFAPHALEELRERHAHRRLGFEDAEIETWMAEAGAVPAASRTIAPKPGEAGALTVKIWAGERTAPQAAVAGAS